MARTPQVKGTCNFCQKQYATSGLTRHLKSCKARKAASAAAKGKSETIYQLRIVNAYSSSFVLHLEARASARLGDIDSYLRTIWLECCGHMSQFSPEAWGDELAMSSKLDQVFQRFDKLVHLYDFGSTTETHIFVLSARNGVPLSKHPLFLMARNEKPNAPCQVCGEQAGYLCMECVYEDDESGMLCDKHGDAHAHDDYGGLHLLVNSPRVGMCGDLGSAEPPY